MQHFILLTCIIPVLNVYFQIEWKTVWILISWLHQKPAGLMKPADQDPQFSIRSQLIRIYSVFKKKDKSELSRTRVNRMVIFRTCLVKMNVLGTVHFVQIKKNKCVLGNRSETVRYTLFIFLNFLLLVFLDRNTS